MNSKRSMNTMTAWDVLQLIKRYEWLFAKAREVEISKKINGRTIDFDSEIGSIKIYSEHYEDKVVRKLRKEQCRNKPDINRCVSSYLRKHRVPDLFLTARGQIFGEKIFRAFFLELGVSDRYYYRKPTIISNSPAGVIYKAVKGGNAVFKMPGGETFNVKKAKEFIEILSADKKFNFDAFKPRKSTKPRVEYEKIAHFFNPVNDMFKRVAGGIPVYFGYAFTDDVLLTMSFIEMSRLGNVANESVVSMGKEEKSKNIILDARELKPLEIAILERIFGVIVSVKDTDGRATIDKKHNSYMIEWIGVPDYKNNRIRNVEFVKKKPKNIEQFILMLKLYADKHKDKR